MTVQIEIVVESDGWGAEADLSISSRKAINAALSQLTITLPEGAEVSTVFTNDAQVHALNKQWRGIDKPTNVLSFAANDGVPPDQWSPLLGDIVLARETLEREAGEQGKSFNAHLLHLIIHGFLHLLGYDHETDGEAEEMEDLERKILAQLDVADPYA